MIRKSREQECIVCCDTLKGSQFPESKITENCTHEANTCIECIGHHIDTQLETRMWNQLNCPECPAMLGYADVKRNASVTTFQRYDSLTMRDGISSDPNFRWCTAPECRSGQFHSEGVESPLMVCNSCRALTCFTHQTPWHEGMTCAEFDNPEASRDVADDSSPFAYQGLLSSLAEMCGWNRETVVGGVKRRETDQEKEDRRLAMRLFEEQEEAERKRLQEIEQENRRMVEVQLAERQEAERREREAQEVRRHELERRRQVQEAQRVRARRQREESQTDTLLQKQTKACPGNCGWRIEKNDGCDHMTCWASPNSNLCYKIADLKFYRLRLSPSILLDMSRALGTHRETRQCIPCNNMQIPYK